MTKLEKVLIIIVTTLLAMICAVATALIADACDICEVGTNNTVKIMVPDVESEPCEHVPEPIDIPMSKNTEESVDELVESSEGAVDDSEEGEKAEKVETIESKIERFLESVSEAAETEIEETVEENEVEYFDVPLDEALQDHIITLCEASGVDVSVVLAMIDRESKFDINAVGDGGHALGLMQIHPRWHGARMAELECWDLMDPYQNMTVAIDYIAELCEIGNGTIEWVLMAYNGGEAYADRKVAAGEVSEYAAEVLAEAERYW